jgi:hypothetical protein
MLARSCGDGREHVVGGGRRAEGAAALGEDAPECIEQDGDEDDNGDLGWNLSA